MTFSEMLEKVSESGKIQLIKNNICRPIDFTKLNEKGIQMLKLCESDEQIVKSIAMRLRMANVVQQNAKVQDIDEYSIRTRKVFTKFKWNKTDLFLHQNSAIILEKLVKYGCPEEDIKKLTVKMIIANIYLNDFFEYKKKL